MGVVHTSSSDLNREMVGYWVPANCATNKVEDGQLATIPPNAGIVNPPHLKPLASHILILKLNR